jgi:hypothetical protein
MKNSLLIVQNTLNTKKPVAIACELCMIVHNQSSKILISVDKTHKDLYKPIFPVFRYNVIIGSTIFNGDAHKQPLCFLRFFRFLHVNLKTWFIFTSKIIAWLSMVFQLCGYLSCDLSLSSAQLSLFRKWTTLMKDTALLDSSQ